MQRRHFLRTLATGIGLAAVGSSTASARREVILPAGQVCRASTGAAQILQVKGNVALSYQGTHILTYGAFRELAQQFGAKSGTGFDVSGGGCDDGIAATRRRVADLGGMCCPVKGSAAEGMPSLLVAHDIKAVIAHPENPLRSLSMNDLRKLARGDITRWENLAEYPRAVALVVRNHCPDYVEPVRQKLLANRPDWSARALFVDTDQQVTETVARFPGAVGVVSWVFARPLAEAGQIRVLALDGVHPSAGVRYPLTGPLSVIFRHWEAQRMKPFFDYLYGPQGQAVIARSLIPVSADEAGYSRRFLQQT